MLHPLFVSFPRRHEPEQEGALREALVAAPTRNLWQKLWIGCRAARRSDGIWIGKRQVFAARI